MPKLSAGLILYREIESEIQVLIGHPGGPFWAKKDDGAWSIIKGEYEEDEDPWKTALREFEEEVGIPAPEGTPIELGEIRQPSGKRITAFASRGDLDVTRARSNEFEMEWPRGSGKMQTFPEIDKVEWFTVAEARRKLLKGQLPFLDVLMNQSALNDFGEGDSKDEDGEMQQSLF